MKVVATGVDFDQVAAAPAPPAAAETIQLLRVDALLDNPNNPRETFETAAMAELAEDVRQHGILEPLMVRPVASQRGEWEIVFGHRRRQAARAAGLATVPCIVRQLDEVEALALTVAENVQREDLSAVEEARGFKKLREARGWTQAQLAESIGKSQGFVANRERLLQLPVELQKKVISREITASAAAVLGSLKPHKNASTYVHVNGTYVDINKLEDLWALAARGVSSHTLEDAAQRWRDEVERREGAEAKSERARQAVKDEAAKLEKKYPGRQVATSYEAYYGYGSGPTTKDMRLQVNTKGDDCWSKSDMCADCKKCERTGFLVQLHGAKPHVWTRCTDQACNDTTKDRLRKAAEARARAASAGTEAMLDRIFSLRIDHDDAIKHLARWLSGSLYSLRDRLDSATTVEQLVRLVLAQKFRNLYDDKGRKAFIAELGLDQEVPSAACASCGRGGLLIGRLCDLCYAESWQSLARVDVRATDANSIQIGMGRPIMEVDLPYVTTTIWDAYREAVERAGGTLDRVAPSQSGDTLRVEWHRGDGKLRQPSKAKAKEAVPA